MAPPTRFDPDVCTIVVVDVQNDFCHPDGKLARSGADVSGTEQMLPSLQQLIAGARSRGVPVVWIQTWRDDTTNSVVWTGRHSLYLNPPPSDVPPANCIKGSWGAGFYRVSPEDGEPVVHKIRYNAFSGTDLEAVLRTIGRPSLLFTGVATNVCVESTLREALFREFHVSLIEDACAATAPGAHAAAIANVERHFGLVRTTAQVLASWQERSPLVATSA